MQAPGTRAVLSLRYTLNRTPIWSHEYQSNPIERITETESVPSGGFGWDGRFSSLHEQAAAPLLAPNEMANRDAAEVTAKLARAPYAAEFRAAFGANVFDEPTRAFDQALLAIERFELDDRSFRPYTSRFDAFLDGKTELGAGELRGLALFRNPHKGNCSSCHPSTLGADGSHPLFTDYTFAVLALPRNREIPANSDSAYFDLGLCGPLRHDQKDEQKECGMFKTPTLRNAAKRGVFFHNGAFHTLRDATRFYAERDAFPVRYYPQKEGVIDVYDDLPLALHGNADHVDAPFNREHASSPALTAQEVDDIVVFLETLTDADVEAARF